MSDSVEPKRMRMIEEEREEEREEGKSGDDHTGLGETEQPPFSVKTWKEDLKLTVEGKEIYVNKALLALVSPVFEKMFTANFKEKHSDELELPGKSYDSFVSFLECVYPGHNKQITAETAFGIIPLANEYQMPDLLARCDTVLSKSIRSTSDMSYIYTTLKLCHLHNLEQTQTRCTELASELPLDQIKANKEKYEISSEVNEKILERGFRRQELDIVEYKVIVKHSKSITESKGAHIKSMQRTYYPDNDAMRKALKDYDYSSLSHKIEQDLKGRGYTITERNNLSGNAQKLFDTKIIQKIDDGEFQCLEKFTLADVQGLNDNEELFRHLPVALKEKIPEAKQT